MKDKIICIYMIISPSAKVYIGQTVDFERREKQYKNKISKNQIKISNSFKKYGSENHLIEILETCNYLDLNEKERYWQDEYKVLGEFGLNCRLTETSTKSGYFSIEARNKLSKAKKGQKFSEEHKQNISIATTGKKLSDETKEKMRNKSPELRQKLSKLYTGVPRSEETKRKIRETLLKRNLVNI